MDRRSALDQRSAAFARSRLEQAVSDMQQLAHTRAELASLDTSEDDLTAAAARIDGEIAIVNGRLHEVLSSVTIDQRRGILDLAWKYGQITEFVFDWPAYFMSEAVQSPISTALGWAWGWSERKQTVEGE